MKIQSEWKFSLEVNYSQKSCAQVMKEIFEEFEDSDDARTEHDYITGLTLPSLSSHASIRQVNFQLVLLEQDLSTEEVLQDLEKHNLRPSTAVEFANFYLHGGCNPIGPEEDVYTQLDGADYLTFVNDHGTSGQLTGLIGWGDSGREVCNTPLETGNPPDDQWDGTFYVVVVEK